MTENHHTHVSVLGLGAMGSALAEALVKAGLRTTVWNRSEGKADMLVEQGAKEAASAAEAVRASRLVIACLFDHDSVHEVLDPLVGDLAGRTLINLTTTKPEQARQLAAWAAEAGIAYLDGGIMAVPSMIGQPGASILYSGSEEVFREHAALLDLWATSTYYGEDAGLASLYDFALLSSMYVMFAGFMHGAALLAPAGVSAGRFAEMAEPWLTAMTGELARFAEVIDGGDYTVPGQQSLEFSNLGLFIEASAEQGVSAEPIAMVQRLIQRQVDAGHGEEGFARIIESIKHPAA
ncbi:MULTISPECIES: NAD(P)-dependent oxidoreductase [unclassified Streptomyces]|uniref:NAD(P)-dependent oxidoreductase n=1 Tax=unclassified Streptomyces TaxID=2593676 RepID=UPI000747D102|nr:MULTISPECIES: NAD(P)-binding domain-containing protein [unclassified Streptomyces]KUL63459.1 6-phosphogluconate dehydrogenase [Streptomyces sp. NRRL S-1521]THC54905.1 NAD(P)-dependent oxidoreductase [Streptomyces sp. A1499]